MTFWDRLFKTDLGEEVGISIHGFNSCIRSYARGDMTRTEISNVMVDGNGDVIPGPELLEAAELLDLVDAAPDKVVKAEEILDALHLAELTWITPAQAKARLGLP
jgi:hypothetical protein